MKGNYNNILTVSVVNRYIKENMSKDLILSNLWLRGEISNFKNHSSGHMYFTLKDEYSLIRCVMFKTYNSRLGFIPESGMQVIVRGYISVFERDGQYQLYAEEMQCDGIGNLHIAFEQLKKKLLNEGLFNSDYKKKLPYIPNSIGVITSPTGSVIKDIINVLDRRFYNSTIKLFPVRVQGERASEEISNAIKKLNELGNVDVIILARGGGSLEELWPFNEETVARSIFKSDIPIVSAIGHETDYTISDFVSDLRAPTPSAAAELVMPEKTLLSNKIGDLKSRLSYSLIRNIDQKRERLRKIRDSIAFGQPYDRIYQERMRLDILSKELKNHMYLRHEEVKNRLHLLIGKLDALSPLSTLSRGYSIVRTEEKGDIIKSIGDVGIGDEIEIDLKDGVLSCIVEKKLKK